MKKLFTLLALVGFMSLGFQSYAQDEEADTTTAMEDTTQVVDEPEPVVEEEPVSLLSTK